MERRGFLKAIFAASVAPAFVRSEWLMTPKPIEVVQSTDWMDIEVPPRLFPFQPHEHNPLHFGNMAWKPELTIVLPVSRNGCRVLPVQPALRHITSLPPLSPKMPFS